MGFTSPTGQRLRLYRRLVRPRGVTTEAVHSGSRKRLSSEHPFRSALFDEHEEIPHLHGCLVSWVAEIDALGCLVVGLAFGLEMVSRNSMTPCPACGAKMRGERSHDVRGPIGTGNGAGWCCWPCGAKGGPVDLASLKAFGEVLKAGDDRWGDLREKCEQLGLLGVRHRTMVPSRLEREFPPPWEVDAVWASCTAIANDRPVSQWALSRKLSPSTLDELDLVRALSPRSPTPEWLKRGERTWLTLHQQYRAVVALWNAKGEMASLHARAVASGDWKAKDKATSPRGYSTAGLVMANLPARELLAGKFDRVAKVAIAEGVPDFLTVAQAHPGSFVLGVISGSWTAEIASRIPNGTSVLVATDQDDDGEKYAKAIASSLVERCTVKRWRAKGDVNEVGLAAGTVEEVSRG